MALHPRLPHLQHPPQEKGQWQRGWIKSKCWDFCGSRWRVGWRSAGFSLFCLWSLFFLLTLMVSGLHLPPLCNGSVNVEADFLRGTGGLHPFLTAHLSGVCAPAHKVQHLSHDRVLFSSPQSHRSHQQDPWQRPSGAGLHLPVDTLPKSPSCWSHWQS